MMSVKIFLSTVSDEFLAYRDQLRRDLTRHNVEIKVQEDFKEYGGSTLEMLDLYINHCDAVIHLVGDMTGSEPPPASVVAFLAKYPNILGKLPLLREPLEQGHGISYTQWEAWLALYHGKPLVIAEADEAAQRGPNYAPTDSSRAAQTEHLRRLRGHERYSSTFTSPDNLAKIVLSSAVLDLLTQQQLPGTLGVLSKFPYPSIVAALFLLLLTPFAAEELAKTLGIALAAPIVLAAAVGGLVLALMYWRYLGILDSAAEPPGSLERRGYESLRESLATGGIGVKLYARWLTAFLDGVDRFFGDTGMADRTLFPRAFGLRTPAPLWTAPAFDRCLLLAFIYPIVIIFIIWSVSGHVGPAEQALNISSNLSTWERAFFSVATGIITFAAWRYVHATRWMALAWVLAPFVVSCCAVAAIGTSSSNHGPLALASVFAIVAAGGFAAAFALVFVLRHVGPHPSARNVAFNVAGVVSIFVDLALTVAFISGDREPLGLFGLSLFVAGSFTGSGVIAVAIASLLPAAIGNGGTGWLGFMIIPALGALPVALGFLVMLLKSIATKHRWQGIFLSIIVIVLITACLGEARFFSAENPEDWKLIGPALLFLGLLTLLNGPFDWASLGVTRALLRRGLELKGWWPYLLALVDALAAGIIVALLALTMVIGVQTFDELAVRRGLAAVLPLRPLFDGLAGQPGSPEFWWVYVLLLSTMIPSLVNLMLGGTALMRAVPGIGLLLLRWLPADRAAPIYDRAWIALVLTLQVAGGIMVGIAAQALLAAGLIFYAMPAAGLSLLDLAQTIASFNLPARVLTWL